jgi:Fe-Mn family superoxide dismutase
MALARRREEPALAPAIDGTEPSNGQFALPPLPFAPDALAPVISARTLDFHYGKHHKAYVDKVNELVKGKPTAGMSLEQIVAKAAKDPEPKALLNNAGQAWNHAFYWHCLSPRISGPSEALNRRIQQDFGGLDKLKETLTKAADEQFGSGWAWLVVNGGRLEVTASSNADTPIAHGQSPLLAIDVWEHAYYLDYQNDRAGHVKAVIDRLLNWSFASENFERSAPGG